MVHKLLHDYAFETLPMHTSFRFKTNETIELADALRARQPVTLLPGTGEADIVLASEWDHLLAAGGDVIPLSFGQLDCQTDAAITLLLDEVARARLGERALYLPEARRCLRRDPETLNFADVLDLLRDTSVAVIDVMTSLRDAAKVQGQRRPSLPAARVASRLDRLALLRAWLTVDRLYVPGLSFHQAKGREWRRHNRVRAGRDEGGRSQALRRAYPRQHRHSAPGDLTAPTGGDDFYTMLRSEHARFFLPEPEG